ncbi:MAG TPA: protocatechuate 3,4-dioxygenase subunit alpha [Burkholderiaceae bacterium]|nr:protocatechuate 3,4-dioxygenase subunit alpha [Burkholderiaceae bacterium]
MSEVATASQTVGPFFKYGLNWNDGDRVFPEDVPGQRIVVCGQVRDGKGDPVPDALLEIWQAGSDGRFGGPTPGSCAGFGRVPTGDDGRFEFRTVLPGAVRGSDGRPQAPHLTVLVFARGLLRQLYTRIYFDDQPGNRDDALLAMAGDRASTLIARRTGPNQYQWDVVLQGPGETVFLEY